MAALLLAGIGIGFAAGMLLKLYHPGGLDRISTVLYRLIG